MLNMILSISLDIGKVHFMVKMLFHRFNNVQTITLFKILDTPLDFIISNMNHKIDPI
jgi:hypothetical protein